MGMSQTYVNAFDVHIFSSHEYLCQQAIWVWQPGFDPQRIGKLTSQPAYQPIGQQIGPFVTNSSTISYIIN